MRTLRRTPLIGQSAASGDFVGSVTPTGPVSNWPLEGSANKIYFDRTTNPVSVYIWNAATTSFEQINGGGGGGGGGSSTPGTDIVLTPLLTYPAATGNALALRNKMVQDPDGLWWIIDNDGDAVKVSSSSYLQRQTSVTNNVLPTAAPVPAINLWLIDVSNMTADLDLTGWTPTGLTVGCTARIRKVDNSPYKITLTEDGKLYSFVNEDTEFYTLVWNGTQFKLI